MGSQEKSHIIEGTETKNRKHWGLAHIYEPRISEFADKKSANYEGHLYSIYSLQVKTHYYSKYNSL